MLLIATGDRHEDAAHDGTADDRRPRCHRQYPSGNDAFARAENVTADHHRVPSIRRRLPMDTSLVERQRRQSKYVSGP